MIVQSKDRVTNYILKNKKCFKIKIGVECEVLSNQFRRAANLLAS